MYHLINQMLIYISISVITALMIDLIVIEGRSKILTLFMVIFGAFTGWCSYIIFVFFTGGLEMFTIWYSLPIILISVTSIYVLIKFADIKIMFRNPHWKIGKYSTIASIVLLFIFLGSFVVLAFVPEVAITGQTVLDTSNDFLNVDGVIHNYKSIPYNTARIAASDITYSGSDTFISIDSYKSYVNFPRIRENPEEDQYLNFEVSFTTTTNGGDWEKPFVKIWIFHDVNNNGIPDGGDSNVDPWCYKFPINTAGGIRNNIMWDASSNTASRQINILTIKGETTILPIVNAFISQEKNDKGLTVSNTPEGYNVPQDMMSWSKTSSDDVILVESVTSYISVPAGSSLPSIRGKFYCHEGPGHYGIIYQAFDCRYHDPFDNDAVPLAQKIDLFEVVEHDQPDQPDVIIESASWITGIFLFGLLGGGSYAVIKVGKKVLIKK